MLYDPNENTIELLDMNGQKVLKYGFDAHFIKEFTTHFPSLAFHKISASDYFFYNSNRISDSTGHKLIQYNAETHKITATYFPINKHMATYFFILDANNFGTTSNLSFHYSSSDTIYGFTDDYTPYPKYVLDFGRHHTPSSFYDEHYDDIADFSTKAAQRSYIYATGNFGENDYMAILSFRNDDQLYWVHLYFFLQPEQFIAYSPGFSEQSNAVLVKCTCKKSRNY
jgi:hypothetical protein